MFYLYQKNKAEECLRTAEKLIKMPDLKGDPKRLGKVHGIMGDILANKKQYSAAKKAYEDSLRADPQNAINLYNYSICLEEMANKEPNEARKASLLQEVRRRLLEACALRQFDACHVP